MKKNFILGQSNEIISDGIIYDLHNLYDFIGVFSNSSKRRCMLLFKPNIDYGLKMPDICLTFIDVNFLELTPDLEANTATDLDEIGYIEFDRQDDSWLMDECQATSADHLLFRFEGGAFLRIHSNLAILSKKSDSES